MIVLPILAGTFKLDGGAMFGVVPKKIWSKLVEPDKDNLCTWALRCLYIEYDEYKILIDTGMGNKQDEKFFSYYQPEGHTNIYDALVLNHIDPTNITDVILTHLHFDHCGGGALKNKYGELFLTFPNARYWSQVDQWKLSLNPNAREKASFLKENLEPLEEAIHFLDEFNTPFDRINFVRVNGHTNGMMLPLIKINENKSILYCADLFPSVHHIPLPYVMAYDMQPLITLQEKLTVLDMVSENNIALFFEHDVENEIALVTKMNGGKYAITKKLTLNEYLEL